MSQASIRAVLRANPNGLTVSSIASRINKPRENTRRQIQTMPDVFIYYWDVAPKHSPVSHVPVYAAVTVPENAPRPI